MNKGVALEVTLLFSYFRLWPSKIKMSMLRVALEQVNPNNPKQVALHFDVVQVPNKIKDKKAKDEAPVQG